MTTYVALLRAINVGGTGKLPMRELTALCERIGFTSVKTYIASGNVVFDSAATAAAVEKKLAAALARYGGKPIGVLLRTAAEMAAIVAANPFPQAAPSRTVAIFLQQAPSRAMLDRITGANDEEVRLGTREVYVHYPSGIGRSKLKIPGTETGTARNMNTIAKLAGMAARERA